MTESRTPPVESGPIRIVIKLIGCLIVVVINALLAMITADVPDGTHPDLAAIALITRVTLVVLIPLLAVLALQVAKRFRNTASRIDIFLVTSLLILIGSLGAVARP